MTKEVTKGKKLSEKEKKIEQFIIKLKSGKEDQVLVAVKGIRADGNEMIISHLIDALVQTKSKKIEQEISNVLLELKTVKAIEPLIAAIEESKNKKYHALLISVFWNAGLNPVEQVNKFVEFAIKGDYMECFESLTVIENLEGDFIEEQLMESIIMLKEHLGKSIDDGKTEMLKSMEVILQKLNNNL